MLSIIIRLTVIGIVVYLIFKILFPPSLRKPQRKAGDKEVIDLNKDEFREIDK